MGIRSTFTWKIDQEAPGSNGKEVAKKPHERYGKKG